MHSLWHWQMNNYKRAVHHLKAENYNELNGCDKPTEKHLSHKQLGKDNSYLHRTTKQIKGPYTMIEHKKHSEYRTTLVNVVFSVYILTSMMGTLDGIDLAALFVCFRVSA